MGAMRPASLLALLAAVATAAALWFARPAPVRAAETATLHVTGLDVGPRERAVVRLYNSSRQAFAVHYTVFALDTLYESPVALSLPGAGVGAQLLPGDTLELDLGEIVTAYRAQQGASAWDAPIRFVAFGTTSGAERFGPETILAEALQTEGGATYRPAVTWTDE